MKKQVVAGLMVAVAMVSFGCSGRNAEFGVVDKYVTYENIDKATDTIKDGVDYIFEKLDGGKDKDK